MKVIKNPNAELILQTIRENDFYCPCKLEKIDDNKCICKEFVECQELGDCACGLYKKIEV